MRRVEEQQAMVVDAAPTPEPVRMGINDALGLMCAEEVVATRSVPGFAQAAVDGYAVRSVDLGGTRGLGSSTAAGDDENAEKSFPVVGEVAAGSPKPLRLQARQAVRVATGAPIPTVADAVLPLEWSDRGTKRVTALQSVQPGDFIRKEGADIQPGDIAVTPGTILGPAQIGLLAAAGRDKVLVYPRPRVTVLSFGLELVDIDANPAPGQVFDINSYSLAAAAEEAGADVNRIGIANAEPARLKETLEKEIGRSEMIVISGGVGGSGAEAIQEVVQEFGDIDTTRVAMHPGSAQGFGLLGPDRVPVFLLPSNPVSALVIFDAIVRPAIRVSLGKRVAERHSVKALALGNISSIAGRRGFVRARLMRDVETRDYLVEALSGTTGEASHLLAGLAEANAMIVIPEDVTDIRPGDTVDVLFIQQRS